MEVKIKHKYLSIEDKTTIIKMRSEGCLISQLSDFFNVTPKTIHTVLNPDYAKRQNITNLARYHKTKKLKVNDSK